jgi:hypothetical protein
MLVARQLFTPFAQRYANANMTYSRAERGNEISEQGKRLRQEICTVSESVDRRNAVM